MPSVERAFTVNGNDVSANKNYLDVRNDILKAKKPVTAIAMIQSIVDRWMLPIC